MFGFITEKHINGKYNKSILFFKSIVLKLKPQDAKFIVKNKNLLLLLALPLFLCLNFKKYFQMETDSEHSQAEHAKENGLKMKKKIKLNYKIYGNISHVNATEKNTYLEFNLV